MSRVWRHCGMVGFSVRMTRLRSVAVLESHLSESPRSAKAPLHRLGRTQIANSDRDAADSLAGCRKDGVEHRRRGDRDGRFADAAPELAIGHNHDLDFRHPVETHHLPRVEVGLLDPAVAYRAFAIEQG